MVASNISMLEGLISSNDLLKIKKLLLAYNFDLSMNYKYSDLKPFIYRDKKMQKGSLNLVLLRGISRGIITSGFDKNNLKKSIL